MNPAEAMTIRTATAKPSPRDNESERREAPHGMQQLIESAGHFQGDDKEGDREGQHGVAEPLDARDFATVAFGTGGARHGAIIQPIQMSHVGW